MPTAFTPPFTPRGLASLVTPPPWHYAGWLLNVEFECDPSAAVAFHQTPREELADLGLRRALRASAGWMGISITGASET